MHTPRCFQCEAGLRSLLTTFSHLGDPLGTCQACHSFVCGHHGQRDAAKRYFRCQPCDAQNLQLAATLQAAKAASQAGATQAEDAAISLAEKLLDEMRPVVRDILRATDRIAVTLEDLAERRPGYVDPERQMNFAQQVREDRRRLEALLGAPELEGIWPTLRELARGDGDTETRRMARQAIALFYGAAWIVWRFSLPPELVTGPIRYVAQAQ